MSWKSKRHSDVRGAGGFQARDVIRCTDQKNGGRTPTTFDINDVMRGWGGGGVIIIDYLDRDWKRITCTPINSSVCVIAEDRLL